MKFAVIGDIHSNIDALKSVVGDIKQKDIDFIISTGDLVGYLPFPNEVIEFMKEEKILCVKGNHDHAIGESAPVGNLEEMTEDEVWAKASAAYTNAVIKPENRQYLRNLPDSLQLVKDGLRIVIVHGSPKKIDEYLFENSDELMRLHEEDCYDVVISGHTHIPYHQTIEHKHYINPGSIGKPKHGNAHSAYVIVSIIEGVVSTESVQIPYTMDDLKQAILEIPYIPNQLIDLLEQGK